jgi:mevalonate kinase
MSKKSSTSCENPLDFRSVQSATYHLSVPSKSFLLGEYVALTGGPALLLSTEPRFELIASKNPNPQQQIDYRQIHPESPAGKLIKRDFPFYGQYQLQFSDPYQGIGGFGASSAQFVLLSAFKKLINAESMNDFNLLEEYQQLSWDGKGFSPSDYDLIAQIHGQICFFHKSKKTIKEYAWPFEEIGFGLLHTGNKLATHQHLKTLKNFDATALTQIVESGIKSIQTANIDNFIEAIKNYASAMQFQGLVAKNTVQMIKELSTHPAILAAKGCGSLASDVIFILFDIQNQTDVVQWLTHKLIKIVYVGKTLASGLET